jgi:putative ABC transport system permease protein
VDSARPVRVGRLAALDVLRLATIGLHTLRLRAILSATGIAIGVAAMVAVLGLSASSKAGLIAEINQLGTNLLVVTPGSNLFGQAVELPIAAPAMIGRIGPVTQVQYTGQTSVNAYRSPLVPSIDTNALSVDASSLGLARAVGTHVAQGVYLNAATAHQPVAVLGAAAAQRLGIDRVIPGERIWVGDTWFYVVGILAPSPLAPEIDSAILVGVPAAERYLAFDGHPTSIYVKSITSETTAVYGVLAATADPESPSSVSVTQPSEALVVQADALGAFDSLFLGLGAVALLVGAVGVANVMVVAVLERRSEIGLRRALGATRRHIRIQFLSEAVVLSLLGGVAGVVLGAISTVVYARLKGWIPDVPVIAWVGGGLAAIVVGVVAGILPAVRASRLSPTEALWSV